MSPNICTKNILRARRARDKLPRPKICHPRLIRHDWCRNIWCNPQTGEVLREVLHNFVDSFVFGQRLQFVLYGADRTSMTSDEALEELKNGRREASFDTR